MREAGFGGMNVAVDTTNRFVVGVQNRDRAVVLLLDAADATIFGITRLARRGTVFAMDSPPRDSDAKGDLANGFGIRP